MDLALLRLRVARWICSVIGHRPAQGRADVIPLKVLCERCGDPIDLVSR